MDENQAGLLGYSGKTVINVPCCLNGALMMPRGRSSLGPNGRFLRVPVRLGWVTRRYEWALCIKYVHAKSAKYLGEFLARLFIQRQTRTLDSIQIPKGEANTAHRTPVWKFLTGRAICQSVTEHGVAQAMCRQSHGYCKLSPGTGRIYAFFRSTSATTTKSSYLFSFCVGDIGVAILF